MIHTYGVDIGTGNIVIATRKSDDSNIEIISTRNMYLPIEDEGFFQTELRDNNLLNYVEVDDKIYIIGEDAFRWGNAMRKEVSRPMSNGVLSTRDINALEIMSGIISKMMDLDRSKENYVVYSIPEQAITIDLVKDPLMPPIFQHEKMFEKMFESMGCESSSLNEGMAVIYSEGAKYDYSCIGMSFGSGLTNVALSYKGQKIFAFSVARGGDWIDRQASESTGKVINLVTAIKEKYLNFNDLKPEGRKKEEIRVINALSISYENALRYVIKTLIKKFKELSDNLGYGESIPIILSGGTAMVPGFSVLFKKIFSEYVDEFPYDISDIILAKDLLNSVALGCYYASVLRKKN